MGRKVSCLEGTYKRRREVITLTLEERVEALEKKMAALEQAGQPEAIESNLSKRIDKYFAEIRTGLEEKLSFLGESSK